jgi:Ca2+-binding RTX toxin-like protein
MRLVPVVLAAAAFLSASPADAATCRFDPAVHSLYVSVGSETATLVQQGGEIQLLDAAGQRACLDSTGTVSSTVTDTDLVQVVSDGSVAIVPASGPFAPGFTPDRGGVSSIEFDIAFTLPGSTAAVSGGPGDDRLVVGADGLDVDGDNDVDVKVFGDPRWVLDGGDGNDVLSAQGGHNTGDALSVPVSLSGGAGNDRLIGGKGDDLLQGGTGDDELQGRSGNDTLVADSSDAAPGDDPEARDHLDGGNGDDLLWGGAGSDTLLGALGSDQLHDADGVRDLVRGGQGEDTGWLDAGLDRIQGVETQL